jgi:hypothetical protein
VGFLFERITYGSEEDLKDHEQLRSDPLLGLQAGMRELDEPLAGKSTLNRLERSWRDSSSPWWHCLLALRSSKAYGASPPCCSLRLNDGAILSGRTS